jgi:hypothetical protein
MSQDSQMPPTASPHESRLRLRIAAVAGAFLMNGLAFGAWASRIPAVQNQTHLDEAHLGFALLGAGLGAVATMSIGGWLGGKVGTHVVTAATLLGCACLIPFMGASSDFWSLLLSLFGFGIFQGTMDVCMNANGLAVERAGSGPIMSRLHATWSIGSFFGALASAQIAALGISVFAEFAVVGLILAIGALVLGATMLPDTHADGGGRLTRPSGRLLLLGSLALCALLAEGSANDWGGVYMHRHLGASEGMAALAVATFSGAMAFSRFVGDKLVVVLGPGVLVSGGAALSTIGLGLVLGVGEPTIAIAGYGLMGLGLAAGVPVLFRAAGSQPGIPPSVGIAAVSTMGYAGGLVGPPLIGSLATVVTLRGSLGLVFLMLAFLALAGRRALAQPAP